MQDPSLNDEGLLVVPLPDLQLPGQVTDSQNEGQPTGMAGNPADLIHVLLRVWEKLLEVGRAHLGMSSHLLPISLTLQERCADGPA